MEDHTIHPDITDLILDDHFFALAKDPAREEELNRFIAAHPDRKEDIRNALMLIRNLKARTVEVPQGVIAARYGTLLKEAGVVRRRRRSLRIAAVSLSGAAVVALAVLLGTGSGGYEGIPEGSLIYGPAQPGENIVISMGEARLELDRDAVVAHSHDGTLSINETEVDAPVTATQGAETVDVSVPFGRRCRVVLSDGSVVWLNSGSRIVYPATFAGDRREVILSGEMYLEVAHDPSRPFSVLTGDVKVDVLGTVFNVSSYDDDDFTRVVLVEGSVAVTTRTEKRTTLAPGQMLEYRGGISTLAPADLAMHTAWKQGVMMIDSIPLGEVFRKLERYYNVTINYDSNYSTKRYKGKFDLSDSAEGALANLSLAEPMVLAREGDTINITFLNPDGL